MIRNSEQPALGAASALVIALALAVAAIHIYLVPREFNKGATGYGTLFILTGVGYLAALALMYMPLSAFATLHSLGRILMVGIAVAAIIAYISLGYFDTLGWITKVFESVLVLAVGADTMLARKSKGRVHESPPRLASQS